MQTDDELARLRMYKLLTEGQGGALRVAGGFVVVPAIMPPANMSTPLVWQQWLEWNGPPAAVEWQVQLKNAEQPLGFPPRNYSADWIAGASAATPGGGAVGSHIVARIECGSGPTARMFFADVRAGRFALGVQERVRISVARWRADDPFLRPVEYQGTIGPAQATDADPPTYSVIHTFTAGENLNQMAVPPGAAWFDFSLTAGAVRVTFTGYTGGNYGSIYRDVGASPPVSIPGPGPYPVPAGAGNVNAIQPSALDGATLSLTFWVR